jgi:hypothetical protein
MIGMIEKQSMSTHPMHNIETNKLAQSKMPNFSKLGNDIGSVFKKVGKIFADE